MISDPEKLADSAARVAEFATAVAACRPAGGSAAVLLRSWVRRAAVAHRWPEIRVLLGSPECAELVAGARQLAERCREQRPGVLGKTLGWFKRAPDTGPLLEATAGALHDLASALELSGGGLGAGLAAVVAEWLAPDSAAARLCALQNRLAERFVAASGLLDRLATGADAPVPESTLGTSDQPSGPAALETVRRIVHDLAERTGDEALWAAVGEWVAEWFAAFGLNGRLRTAPAASANAAGLDEVFPLRQSPNRSVVLQVGPVTLKTSVLVASSSPAPAGQGLVSAAGPWADLPTPPEWPGLVPEPLTEWAGRANGHGADVARTRFERWLPTAAGRAWFAQCLSVAARERGSAARWWQALRAAGWCRAYPDLDPDTDPPIAVWPKDLPARWPVQESVAAEGPAGRIVEVRTYAPTPAESRFVVSDGCPAPGSPAARFHTLYAAVGPVPAWWANGLWEEARELCAEPPADPSRPAALVGRWLDLLPPNAPASSVLSAVREWAGAFGLELVVPAVGGESAQRTEGTQELDVSFAFSPLPAGRVIRAVGFGLTSFGRVFRRGAVEVSLGRIPPKFLELETAAERLPPADPSRERVARLRDALRGDYLREAALELYVDFWGASGGAALGTAPTPRHEFADRLTEFLHAAYGLSAFVPQSIHDYPDGWLAVVPGGRAVTGLVRRVYRPGLHDERGNLSIPALVEVE